MRSLRVQKRGTRLLVNCDRVVAALGLGSSVAVNGVCLTCEEVDARGFGASLLAETLGTTNLGQLKPRSRVNLEPPLRMGDPIGGHLLQGHVDTTLQVTSFTPARRGKDATLICELTEQLKPLVFSGASIGLNGVSLTVRSVRDSMLTVNLIPETLERTNLGELKPDERVNCEVDLIIKTVYHSLQVRALNAQLTPEALKRLGYD